MRNKVNFLAIILLLFCSGVVFAYAQTPPSLNPVQFTEPLVLSRGEISPAVAESLYLKEEDVCSWTTTQWGWEDKSCAKSEALIFAPTDRLDNVLIEKPISKGFVPFKDWEHKNRDQQINFIWSSLEHSTKAQGKALGVKISLDEWLVYPTLDKEKKILYFATKLDWGGVAHINIEASKFDRQGYVRFLMVPIRNDASPAVIKEMVEEMVSLYEPTAGQTYASFEQGDRVASSGVIGVLADLLGVDYTKASLSSGGARLVGLIAVLWFLGAIPMMARRRAPAPVQRREPEGEYGGS